MGTEAYPFRYLCIMTGLDARSTPLARFYEFDLVVILMGSTMNAINEGQCMRSDTFLFSKEKQSKRINCRHTMKKKIIDDHMHACELAS